MQIDKFDSNNHKFNLFKSIEVSNIYGKKEFNTYFFENLYLNFNNIVFKKRCKNIQNLMHFYLFYFNKLNKNKFNFLQNKKIFLYSIININLKKKKYEI